MGHFTRAGDRTGQTDTEERKFLICFGVLAQSLSASHTGHPEESSATGEDDEEHGRRRRSSDGEAAAGARPRGGCGGGGGAVQVAGGPRRRRLHQADAAPHVSPRPLPHPTSHPPIPSSSPALFTVLTVQLFRYINSDALPSLPVPSMLGEIFLFFLIRFRRLRGKASVVFAYSNLLLAYPTIGRVDKKIVLQQLSNNYWDNLIIYPNSSLRNEEL